MQMRNISGIPDLVTGAVLLRAPLREVAVLLPLSARWHGMGGSLSGTTLYPLGPPGSHSRSRCRACLSSGAHLLQGPGRWPPRSSSEGRAAPLGLTASHTPPQPSCNVCARRSTARSFRIYSECLQRHQEDAGEVL
ncbi:hypothetical protein NDU88_000344 [Pleurodeles waltl]|uniref:Uncharacterized protein n=1 Tax=Pleurodeles waltl TaxID=8319 RepID=A0AAV7S6Q1_PLEWA|nr:hypothetical protein NDU88_000344 [Pleurodeles waltl]